MVYLKITTNLSHHETYGAIPRTPNSTILCAFWESHMNVKGKKHMFNSPCKGIIQINH